MANIKLKKLSLGKLKSVFYDVIAIDGYSGQIVFASIIDNDNDLKPYQFEINKKNTVYVDSLRRYYSTDGNKYDIDKKKQSGSDFSHMIINKKDSTEETNDSILLTAYVYTREGETLESKIYDKLYANTSIPLLEEWMPYIISSLRAHNYLRGLDIDCIYENDPFTGYRLRVSTSQLLSIVQEGIREKHISISNAEENSDLMEYTEGLDSYLNIFGENLAERIQSSFHPKFDPSKDEYSEWVNYYDDSCYHNGIELYQAQKAVVQASVNNLNKNNVTFVIGEMGCGKTAVGSGITYAHYGQQVGMTNVVMCPSHLVEKWKREVERLVPNAKGYIINNIEELIQIENKIKNKNKREHTFIILSKETAKFSYELRPSAVWSKTKNTFICPCCGQKLQKKVKIGTGKSANMMQVDFEKLDMLSKLTYNSYCENEVRYYDKKESKYKTKKCHTSLWSPLNKEDKKTGWVKLGKEGWIKKDHISDIINEFVSRETLVKKDNELLAKLVEVQGNIEDGKEKGLKAPRKYSIAKYIKKKFKGKIDYVLLDELHLYKGDSKQGQAMADLIKASKNVIGLTGTLLNGYADGLFYILYRALPKLMKSEGFEYSDETNFMRTYGVMRKFSNYSFTNNTLGDRVGMSKEKKLPGVSPLVFTKFLLENSVFLSLSDMDGGLPSYEEIPMPIRMDEELSAAYTVLENELRRACGVGRNGHGAKVMGALLQTLSVYPDMPYNQPSVLHPDTNELLVTPRQLGEGLRNKENALLNLVKEKVDNGEKVLVYYEWTNKTDVAQKLLNMFKENNIKALVMTSSITASEREVWIENQLEKGIDVLICNPKLVETGLDLLAFTNIIFYQVGYNIFTMRQASRRSWRLSQDKDIKVYFLYYENTIQAQALSLMATKLQASMAIEGKFSEEGLRAMSNNEDLLTQIANSVVEGIKDTVQTNTFATVNSSERVHEDSRERISLKHLLVPQPINYHLSYLDRQSAINKSKSNTKLLTDILNFKVPLKDII